MRHVLGVLLAAAMVLVLFFVAGWGVARISALHSGGASLTGAGGLAALAAVLVTGVLAFAGAMMVVPLFVPSRWRTRGGAAFVDLDEPPGEYGLIR